MKVYDDMEIKENEDGTLSVNLDGEWVQDYIVSYLALLENVLSGRKTPDLLSDLKKEMEDVTKNTISFLNDIKCSRLVKQLYVNKLIKELERCLKELEKE